MRRVVAAFFFPAVESSREDFEATGFARIRLADVPASEFESGYNSLDVGHGIAQRPCVAVFRSFSLPDLRVTVLIVRSVTIRKSSRATSGLIRNNPAIWPNIAQKIA